MTLRAVAVFVAFVMFLLAGCGESDVGTPTSPTSPVSATFDGTLAPGGWASRSFRTGDAGVVSVTLISTGAAVPVGLGVGIPRADGTGCNLTRSTESVAAAGPHLSVAVDGGTYCVKIYDIVGMAVPLPFVIGITHP